MGDHLRVQVVLLVFHAFLLWAAWVTGRPTFPTEEVKGVPSRPKRPCSYPRCPNLTTERYCEVHKKEYRQQQDRERGTAAQRGYGSRWQKARLRYLRQHPLCVKCMEEGRLTPATVVDHIQPHKGDPVLFWDESNWQALCKPCHDRKTAWEDGGFGR